MANEALLDYIDAKVLLSMRKHEVFDHGEEDKAKDIPILEERIKILEEEIRGN